MQCAPKCYKGDSNAFWRQHVLPQYAQPGTGLPTCLPSQRQPACLHYLRLHYLRMSVKDYFPRVTGEQPPEVFQHTGKVGESCFLDKEDRFPKPDDAADDDWRHNLREARKRNTPSGKPANRGWIFDYSKVIQMQSRIIVQI